MKPTMVRYEGAVVVGIDIATTNAAESDPARAKIGGLWARFRQEDVLGQIPGKIAPAMPMGVYTDYESDDTGRYRLLAGAAVAKGTRPPAGLAQAVVPAGPYLLFRGEGELPTSVIETWKAIWAYFATPGHEVRAYTTDFERYPGPRDVEIYVSVR